MHIYDISRPLHSAMTTYPGDPTFSRRLHTAMATGAPCDVSQLSMGAHAGTHVDAPAHFLPGGATMESLPLTTLVGPCRVLEVGRCGLVQPEELSDLQAGERLLLRTPNSTHNLDEPFRKDYTALSPSAAQKLIDAGVALVGIDYLSVEPYGTENAPVHKTLLGANIIILEGLNLQDIAPGRYFLVALPLLIPGAEGSPTRAILLEEEPC